MDTLEQTGYLVVPTGMDVTAYRREFLETLHSLPSFAEHATKFSVDHAGGVATPGSYHNTLGRRVRKECYRLIEPILAPIANKANLARMETHPTWMVHRPPKQAPSGQTWHRDTSPRAQPGDRVFGGWVNLSEGSVYLSCVPGTHAPGENQGRGYDKFTAEETKRLKLCRRRKRVEIPPGNILIFYENLIHEFDTTKHPFEQCRVHLSYRLTNDTEPQVKNLDHVLDEQAVVTPNSNAPAAMYSNNYARFYPERINEFSRNNILERLLCLDGRVPRFMPSLKQARLPLYPPYSDEERALYRPTRLLANWVTQDLRGSQQ